MKTYIIDHIIPGARLIAHPSKRYQVLDCHTGRLIGWRRSIGGARTLAQGHLIRDWRSPHADGTPRTVE